MGKNIENFNPILSKIIRPVAAIKYVFPVQVYIY